MLLNTEGGRQISRVAGVAALCILAFSSWAAAQTLQPKAVQPPEAQQSPIPEAQQPTSPQGQPAPPQWALGCSNTQAGLDCSATQSILVAQGGRNVRVSALVRIPPDTKKPVLLLALPLGVYLPSGVTLQFGNGGPKAIPFQSCNPSGCVAEYAIAQAEIASLQNGTGLTLSVQTVDKTSFKFNLPAAGFAAAYAKIKTQ